MTDFMSLTKPQLAALEALFAQDLPGGERAVIAQRAGDALVARGCAKPMVIDFPSRFGPLRVKTWKITLKGHYAYCNSCRDFPAEDIA